MRWHGLCTISQHQDTGLLQGEKEMLSQQYQQHHVLDTFMALVKEIATISVYDVKPKDEQGRKILNKCHEMKRRRISSLQHKLSEDVKCLISGSK
jgi:hypothetical protein